MILPHTAYWDMAPFMDPRSKTTYTAFDNIKVKCRDPSEVASLQAETALPITREETGPSDSASTAMPTPQEEADGSSGTPEAKRKKKTTLKVQKHNPHPVNQRGLPS